MEFNVNSKVLEKILSKVIPAVPTRSPMPILDNFLFDIKDEKLTVFATDLEISLKCSLGISSRENIKMVVPARLLYDIIRNLDETQIIFKVEQNSKLKLVTDNGEYTLSYSSPENFPAVPVITKDNEINISGVDLKRALDHTSFAMSKEDMRPAMTGTLLEFSEEGLRFVATDGHRLVKFINKSIKSDIEAQYIIPERAIAVLSKVLTDSNLNILLSPTHISFYIDDLEFISRLIGEKYPAYASVIPLENEHILKVKTNELHSAIKRMLLFSSANTKQVKFSLNENNLEVSSEDIDHGSNAKEKILCEYKGEIMDIGFNTGYVNDILSHVSNEELIFKMHSPTKACIIEPSEFKENEDIMLLLMPVRLNS